MAGFVGPDAPINEPNNLRTLGDIAKQATKAALFPLSKPADVAAPVAEAFVGPDAPISDPEQFNADPAKGPAFPNMSSYPSSAATDPTIDDISTLFLAKDAATLGVKGGMKLTDMALSKLPKNAAKLKAIDALDSTAKLPAQPDLIPAMESSVKPTMGLERLKTAIKSSVTGEVSGGHKAAGDFAKKQMELAKSEQAKHEIDFADWLQTAKEGDTFPLGDGNTATFKGVQKGVPEAGVADTPLLDLKGENLPDEFAMKGDLSHTVTPDTITEKRLLKAPVSAESKTMRETHIKSKGFLDAKGNFIGPDEAISRLEGQGPEASQAFATERPFISDKSGVVPTRPAPPAKDAIRFTRKDIKEINTEAGTSLPVPPEQTRLPLGRVEQGRPTEPFKMPGPAHPMAEGAKARIAEFQAKTGTDLPNKNPFSTSSEMVTKTGDLRPVVREQLQTGLKAEAKAEKAANDVFVDIERKYKFEPDSLDSKVLSKYMRNPNKAAAAQELRTHLGPDAEKFINAEKEIRVHFDRWRNEVNDVRRANGLPEVPFKEDYLPQIHETNVLGLLGKPELIGTPQGQEIMDAMMTGAEKVKQSKFVHLDEIAFRHLKHQGVPDIEDAIKGMEMYGREAERLKALQPHINELRQTAEVIKDKMPNLAKEYVERADHIAGKQQALDVALKDMFGADKFQLFVDASNRMKSNLIEGNVSVPASQLLVLPSVTASVPVRSSLASTVKLMGQPEFRQFLIANSPTLQLRLEGRVASGLHKSGARKLLSAPSELVDEYTLMYGLGAKYITGIRNGLSSAEAMKEAEQFASITQATLSKLNTAPVLRSKAAQAGLPFMNQVLTQGRYVTTQMMKGLPLGEKAKTAAKYVATAIAVSQIGKLLIGDKAHSSFDPSQYVPMGPALSQGIGGPVVGGMGRMLKAQNAEQLLLQTFRNAMLYQRKIPAGLMVSKAVESLFKTKAKSKRRTD